MNDSIRASIFDRATSGVNEVLLQLEEVSQHLTDGEDLAALGALSGLSERLQYVEVLLTVLRDIESKRPMPRNHN